jgi:putative mRNA 3-end processing factor
MCEKLHKAKGCAESGDGATSLFMRALKPEALLHPTPQGLYCPPGDFYIDPVRSVERAVITHGHSDHARPGHTHVLATPETLAIMAIRMGETHAGATQAIQYGETVSINGVDVSALPAGHVLGSAQILVEHKGLKICVSGDYKRRADPTCATFTPVKAHVFVTEATFGLPVFRHPDDTVEIGKLITSLAAVSDRRASGRRLRAGQGAADHQADPADRIQSADLHPWRADQTLRSV